MGSSYALALSSSMKYMQPNKVELSGNRLGKSAEQLLKSMTHEVRYLDLSNNKLSTKAMYMLSEWLERTSMT